MRLRYLLYILLLPGALLFGAEQPVPSKGVLDLRNWNGENIILSGEWEYYDSLLLTPAQLDTLPHLQPQYLRVPFLLRNLPRRNPSSFGYGTLRLRLHHVPDSVPLAISYQRLFSATAIWLNGKLVATNGHVATTAQEEVPLARAHINFFQGKDQVDIVIQISNFHHRKGGMPYPMEFGQANTLNKTVNIRVIIDAFLFGIILLISFFQFGIFVYRRGNLYSLYFALFGFAMAAYGMGNNQVILAHAWPSVPWAFYMKINFLATLLRIWLWAAFLNALYPEDVRKGFVRFLAYPSALLSLFILFTPSRLYTFTLPPIIGLSAITMVYLGWAIVRTVMKKREGALYTFFGTLSILLTGVNDILLELHLIKSVFLLPLGVFLFFLLQSLMLAMHFAKSFNRVEDLTAEMRYMNEGLEDLVLQRTVEIETQKEEILAQRDEIERQRDAVSEHRDLVLSQNKEINTSILYALRIQQAALPPEQTWKEAFADSFVYYHPRDVVSGDFYWFKEFEIDERPIYVWATADCTGHGVPGSFLSILGISLLNGIVPHFYDTTAAQILEQMRREFKQILHQQEGFRERKDGIDMALCIYDVQRRHLQFSGAFSHLFVVRQGGLEEYKGIPNPIGIHHLEAPFENTELELLAGDCIYLFSDGYTDQLGGPFNTKFTRKQFKKLLTELASLPMRQQKERLVKALHDWRKDYRQIDDIMVLGIRV